MKLFKTDNMDTVRQGQQNNNFHLPSVTVVNKLSYLSQNSLQIVATCCTVIRLMYLLLVNLYILLFASYGRPA